MVGQRDLVKKTTEPGSISQPRGFRPEIQGLRAIAVLLVLVFHIWPDLIPGGYIGVDVFFVISGFLITRLLFKEYNETGTLNLTLFYIRRIKRLLPAACLVLTAVLLGISLLPEVRWTETAIGAMASSLYVQNWWLASQATDYLASEQAPSILQHFWSLSVEEQYYFFWPVILLTVASLFKGVPNHKRSLFSVLISIVIICSLIYSIWLSVHTPGLAYFSTFTRAWELGFGGLLAVMTFGRKAALGALLRNVISWLGLALIFIAALSFDEHTVFPGYSALLPVLGATFIIFAGSSTSKISAGTVLSGRVFQYFGDISYSLYLWHWPVITLYKVLTLRDIGVVDGLLIFVVSVALAHQTKFMVEDYFRDRVSWTKAKWKPFSFAGGSIVSFVLVATLMTERVDSQDEGAKSAVSVTASTIKTSTNPGALVLTDDWKVAAKHPALLPTAENARQDWPSPYVDGCISLTDESEVKVCEYGASNPTFKVALIGDTNAAQWEPALAKIAQDNSWKLLVISKSRCAVGSAVSTIKGKEYQECTEWNDHLYGALMELDPDMVLFAQSPRINVLGASGREERYFALSESLVEFANNVKGEGIKLGFIKSTPHMFGDCSLKSEDADIRKCIRARDEAIADLDPMVFAAQSISGSTLIDLTDAICNVSSCPAVVGNVLVRRDSQHLTATYARTTASEMSRQLMRAVDLVYKPAVDLHSNSKAEVEPTYSPTQARRDNPDVYRDGCHVNQKDTDPESCIYGDKSSPFKVVITGDSHAAQWVPPLQDLANKNGWLLQTFTKSACAFTDAVVTRSGREYKSCSEWNKNVLAKIIETQPDLVVTSQSSAHKALLAESSEDNLSILSDGLVSRWQELMQAGVRVVAIKDTPWMLNDIPDCLSSRRFSGAMCNTPRDVAFKRDDAVLFAAKKFPSVHLVDLSDEICDVDCPAISNGMIMWRDKHHLTASYARTLAPYIESTLSDFGLIASSNN